MGGTGGRLARSVGTGLVSGIFTIAVATTGALAASGGGDHLLVVQRSGEQAAALAGTDSRTVASYQDFVVVEAGAADAAALTNAGADLRDDLQTLTVDGRTFDPVGGGAQLSARRLERGASALALVQFVGPIKDAWLDRLAKTGVRVVSYMAQDGYLVHGSASQLTDLVGLVGSDPAVRAVVPYTVDDKIAAGVQAGIQPLAVQTLTGADGDAVRGALRVAGSRFRDPSTVGPFRTQFLRLDRAAAAELAADPGVIAVLPSPDPELLDERQAQILANNISGSGPSSPTYLSFFNGLGLGGSTFPFIVDVTDSGLDAGTVATNHPDLHQGGLLANPSRIAYVKDYTTDPDGRDCIGHATINSGIIAGFNSGSGSTGTGAVEDAQGYNYGLGIAPVAKVGGSKIFTCTGAFSLSGTFAALATAAYNAGARISNNSWGAAVGGAYNADSQAYDKIVRDALPGTAGNQGMVELFSAGNSGSGANTIGSPGTAKNVITVGASEGVELSGITDGCGVPPSGANNFSDIINFSSRGPTDDGRRKPDVVGPGTHITGTKPQIAAYNGSGVCNATFPAGNTLYSLSSGTSHSTPALAGVAAALRQWYRINVGGGTVNLSPAMTKAILAQSSTDLVGGSNGAGGINTNVPDQIQGWGIGNTAAALGTAPGRAFRDQKDVFGSSGQSFTRTFTVADTTKPVRVTLAWTDRFGPTTGNAFVNDLNLTVTSGGNTFKGNVFSGGFSATGGTADSRNNLESVYLPAGTSGSYTITVSAQNIAGDGVPGNADTTDQDFALAVSNRQPAG